MAETITEMVQKLQQLKKCIRDEMPKAISEVMLKETRENFQKEAYLNDGTTEKWKERLYDLHNTPAGMKLQYPKLRRTGRLYNSIRKKAEPYKAIVKTYTPYAKLQNEGGKSPKRWVQPQYKINRKPPNIPARRFMGVGQETYSKANDEILAIWDKNFKK